MESNETLRQIKTGAVVEVVTFLASDFERIAVEFLPEWVRVTEDGGRTSWLAPRSEFVAVDASEAPRVERCGSGWTGDRCTKVLGHRGFHSNE